MKKRNIVVSPGSSRAFVQIESLARCEQAQVATERRTGGALWNSGQKGDGRGKGGLMLSPRSAFVLHRFTGLQAVPGKQSCSQLRSRL